MAQMFIEVITTEIADPDAEPIDRRIIDYHDPRARGWLGKHCYWAFCNGYAVHTARKFVTD